MKKISVIFAIIFIFVIISGGCANNSRVEGELIRIHVRANSDLASDQEVKLAVKQNVVEYLTPVLENQTDFNEALKSVRAEISALEELANQTLRQNGKNYGASVRLTREFFPARAYENIVVESGVYDALIIELGEADGANWWCVIYPPLCFVNANDYGSSFSYKSKILELWQKYVSPS